MYKWKIRHTIFADSLPNEQPSEFKGSVGDSILMDILSFFIILFTLGIATPWVICLKQRWRDSHTYINGVRLKFIGTGVSLIGNYLLWFFLSIITLGIYSFWFKLNVMKWEASHQIIDESSEDKSDVQSAKQIISEFFSKNKKIFITSSIAISVVMIVVIITGYLYTNRPFVIKDGELVRYQGTATEVVIPNRVNCIGDFAFTGNANLTSVIIPNGVTSIGNSAFSSCINLTDITIPNSVVTMGKEVFLYCTDLTIRVEAGSKPDGWDPNWNNSDCIVLWLNSDMYENSEFYYVITDDDTIMIKAYLGENNEVVVPSMIKGKLVTSIGNEAFSNCTSLTVIEVPESVTSIGESAFYNCTSLTGINISENVTSIGGEAFSNCTDLQNIVIPSNVTRIGENAFIGCISLVIYAKVHSIPSDWDSSWNYSGRPVYWGVKEYQEGEGFQYNKN